MSYRVQALVHDNVPEGPARQPLQIAVLRWVEEHPAAALGIGIAVTYVTCVTYVT